MSLIGFSQGSLGITRRICGLLVFMSFSKELKCQLLFRINLSCFVAGHIFSYTGTIWWAIEKWSKSLIKIDLINSMSLITKQGLLLAAQDPKNGLSWKLLYSLSETSWIDSCPHFGSIFSGVQITPWSIQKAFCFLINLCL